MSRIYSDLEDFEENWFEFDDKQHWTRTEVIEANNAGEERTLALLHERATACNLVYPDGTVITDPKQLTKTVVDGLYVEMIGFVGGALSNYLTRRQVLGNVTVRHSSDLNGRATAPKFQKS